MKKIILVGLLLVPSFVFANVRINEVAWMGDTVSSYNEWIELYNDNDTVQDLSGWTIVTTDGKFSISLSKTIQPKGYFLLEHVKADAEKSTASDTVSYTGTYFNNNGGIILLLKNGDVEIDRIDAMEKWPAGNIDKTKEETMQWDGSKWVTASATKKTVYVAGSEISETATTAPNDTSDPTTSYTSSLDTSAHISPLSLSDFSQKQELYISAGRNRITAVGSPVVFEAFAIDAKGVKSPGITSTWSFGDGTQANGTKVTHTYKYQGDYVVVLNASVGGNEAVSRAEIKVFAPKTILAMESDGAVSLQNDSAYEINIGGWKIAGVGRNFVASSDTIIKAGKKLIFSKVITGIDFINDVSLDLLSPDGTVVASFTKPKQAMTIASTTPMEISSEGSTQRSKNVEIDAPLIIVQKTKPKTQTAGIALSVPEKVQESTDSTPKQTIILKKPEGFFAKIWNFLFR